MHLADITIKLATRQDCSSLLALQKECYLQEARINNDFTIPPLMQTIDEYVFEFPDYTTLKAVYKNSIIGSVRSNRVGKTAKIGRFFVKPELQRQGIGTMLLQEIEKANTTAKKFELFTGKESTHNISFYVRQGYRRVGQRMLTDKTTIVIMEKNLQPYDFR